MKTEYIPGQQIREFIETIQPPADCEQSFEYGFYSGDYSVTNSPYPPLRRELEKVRVAAFTRWQNRLINFDEIIQWVEGGAEDPLTKERTLDVAPGTQQEITVLLINNEVFTRHW